MGVAWCSGRAPVVLRCGSRKPLRLLNLRSGLFCSGMPAAQRAMMGQQSAIRHSRGICLLCLPLGSPGLPSRPHNVGSAELWRGSRNRLRLGCSRRGHRLQSCGLPPGVLPLLRFQHQPADSLRSGARTLDIKVLPRQGPRLEEAHTSLQLCPVPAAVLALLLRQSLAIGAGGRAEFRPRAQLSRSARVPGFDIATAALLAEKHIVNPDAASAALGDAVIKPFHLVIASHGVAVSAARPRGTGLLIGINFIT